VTRTVRTAVLAPALLGLAALLAWAVSGLPAFGDYRGPYGYLLNSVVVPLRHTTNVVIGTTFDVRGIDTMGEELMLFAAVLGVMLLLRSKDRSPQGRRSERLGTDGVRLLGVLMVGGGILVGLWLIAFGYVTPGGGFQGGVVVAGAALLLYLVGGRRDYAPFRNEELLDPLEAVGAGGYVVIGLAALVSGLPFLENLLPSGKAGTLLSGGSIPFLNWASGLEVAAAVLVLFAEFLETYIAPLDRDAES
jgi:multicomponent Na+:H+ antiporter subunit B